VVFVARGKFDGFAVLDVWGRVSGGRREVFSVSFLTARQSVGADFSTAGLPIDG
jgi:hypothetical protein